jgi:hypothetical protein
MLDLLNYYTTVFRFYFYVLLVYQTQNLEKHGGLLNYWGCGTSDKAVIVGQGNTIRTMQFPVRLISMQI